MLSSICKGPAWSHKMIYLPAVWLCVFVHWLWSAWKTSETHSAVDTGGLAPSTFIGAVLSPLLLAIASEVFIRICDSFNGTPLSEGENILVWFRLLPEFGSEFLLPWNSFSCKFFPGAGVFVFLSGSSFWQPDTVLRSSTLLSKQETFMQNNKNSVVRVNMGAMKETVRQWK